MSVQVQEDVKESSNKNIYSVYKKIDSHMNRDSIFYRFVLIHKFQKLIL